MFLCVSMSGSGPFLIPTHAKCPKVPFSGRERCVFVFLLLGSGKCAVDTA